MSAIEKTTDHAGEALERLLEQLEGKGRLEALVRSYVAGAQDLEDVLWEMHTAGFDLDTAVGAQLDIIGAIVGAKREQSEEPEALIVTLGAGDVITTLSGVALAAEGETFGEGDDTYRLVLKGWMRALRSDGRARDLYRIMRILVGDGIELHVREQPPAQVWCQVREDVDNAIPGILAELLGIAGAAGVRVIVSHPPSGAATGLRLADAGGGETSGDATLADEGGGHTGGLLADGIEGIAA